MVFVTWICCSGGLAEVLRWFRFWVCCYGCFSRCLWLPVIVGGWLFCFYVVFGFCLDALLLECFFVLLGLFSRLFSCAFVGVW